MPTPTRTFLVTGGTGFLGAHLVRQLIRDEGAAVVILARGRDRGLERLGARFVEGSVLDQAAVARAMEGVDGVFHLAGKVERNLERAHVLYTLHVSGNRNVIEAAGAAGVKRVVVASTSGTVGVTRDGAIVPNDRSPHATETVKDWPYYLSKVYAEKTARSAATRAGVEVILMRPTLLLGPGDERLSSTHDVKLFLDGKIPFIPSGGLSFVDVRDTAAAFRAAFERGTPGASYLLGAANMTMEAFFERLENISGAKSPLFRLPDNAALLGARLLDAALAALGKPSEVDPVSVEMSQHFWYIDWSAAIHDLGFRPRDPGETLYDTVEWLKANGHALATPPAPKADKPAPKPAGRSTAARPPLVEAEPLDDDAEPPPPPRRAPTAHTGHSRVLREEINPDGPGLEGLVSGLGGALGGLLKGRRREPERSSGADLRAEVERKLQSADEARLRSILHQLEDE